MRTIPSKYKASDPELKEYASMLRKACEDLKSAQARSLEYAVYAGKVVAEIKEHLKTSTTLLTFKKFLEVYCPELKQRSANTYHQVYIQVSKNSKTSYSNISEVLKDWRKDHPKRSRFMAMADKSKKMLSEVPIPDLPDTQKVESIGMLEWLEPKPDQLFVFTSDPSFTVQKVERSGQDYPSYKFLTDPVPLKKHDKVRIDNNTRGGQTVCELLGGRSSKNKFFRIATDQFSKHFTPEEKVTPVPPPNKDTDATDTQVEFREVAKTLLAKIWAVSEYLDSLDPNDVEQQLNKAERFAVSMAVDEMRVRINDHVEVPDDDDEVEDEEDEELVGGLNYRARLGSTLPNRAFPSGPPYMNEEDQALYNRYLAAMAAAKAKPKKVSIPSAAPDDTEEREEREQMEALMKRRAAAALEDDDLEDDDISPRK